MVEIDDDFEDVPASKWEELYRRAVSVRREAWVPYSNFGVGAALWTADDEIVAGANVESASIGATVCAERTAIGTSISRGVRSFRALCVVTDHDPPESPCGICRQVLGEFCDELPILLANVDGDHEFTTLTELFPDPFVRRHDDFEI